MDIPSPKNLHELQAVLGACGYYSRFVEKYAKFMDPFRDLLSPTVKYKWTEKHEIAFKKFRENFLRTVPLSQYMHDKPFHLQTDASKKGISGILFQIDDEGYERIVALVSRCLSTHEVYHTITELEVLAVVYYYYTIA